MQSLFSPIAIPFRVETHTKKSLRCIVAFMSGTEITTQYSTVGSVSSLMLRFVGDSMPINTTMEKIQCDDIVCDLLSSTGILTNRPTVIIYNCNFSHSWVNGHLL